MLSGVRVLVQRKKVRAVPWEMVYVRKCLRPLRTDLRPTKKRPRSGERVQDQRKKRLRPRGTYFSQIESAYNAATVDDGFEA